MLKISLADLPVRNVRGTLDERGDHSSECQEGLVDVTSFSGAALHGAGAADVLAAGQVDEIELANFHQLLAVVSVLLDVYRDREDGVGAAGMCVHQRGSRLAFERALGENAVHLQNEIIAIYQCQRS